MQIRTPPATFYRCPGEPHPISRAVHLARLGRSYAKCRDCPHRADSGLVPIAVLNRSTEQPATTAMGLTLTSDGVRGRYLNDLTRHDGQRWGAAVAGWLTERYPAVGRINDSPADDASDQHSSTRRPPTVIVGYDERPSSPDLAIGVVTGLRQSGCRVVDIGQATKSVWSFACAHLSGNAGVFVTGAGYDPSWTGFDIAGECGIPLDGAGELAALQSAALRPGGRPTRVASVVETFPSLAPYEARLQNHFHALRPLRLACATASVITAAILERALLSSPCSTQLAVGPEWRSSAHLERKFGDAFPADGYDVGVWIHEDSQQVRLLDEAGRLLPTETWTNWLTTASLRDPHPGTEAVCVVADPGETEPCQSLCQFFFRLIRDRAACGVDPLGRYWHGDTVPRCDAVVTLAAVLRAMSWSDAPLSEQLTRTTSADVASPSDAGA